MNKPKCQIVKRKTPAEVDFEIGSQRIFYGVNLAFREKRISKPTLRCFVQTMTCFQMLQLKNFGRCSLKRVRLWGQRHKVTTNCKCGHFSHSHPMDAKTPKRFYAAVEIAAQEFGVEFRNILSPMRGSSIAKARHSVVLVCRWVFCMSTPEIGRWLGRDASTVRYAHDVARERFDLIGSTHRVVVRCRNEISP